MDTRTLVRASLFASLIAILGLVPRIDIPVAAGVPITAQTFGVMLAGLMLGARVGAISVLLFLLVIALGAPLLSGGRGGIGVFFGPTAGYLVGWVFGAAAVGFLMQKLPISPVFLRALVACLVGGVFTIYLFGIPYLAVVARLSFDKALLAGLVFLPGDILKAVAAALVARSYFPQRAGVK